MSRIGKKPIDIPEGVEVKVNGSEVTVKGPKGTLTQSFNACMSYELKGNQSNVPTMRLKPRCSTVPLELSSQTWSRVSQKVSKKL